MNCLLPSTLAVSGFKLYLEGIAVCQVYDPNATAMDCQVILSADITNFILTAIFNDVTERPQSAPFAFSIPGNELIAVIATDIFRGTAPLSVNSSAAFSTGTIASYHWEFGGASLATGSSINHIYMTAGYYTANLVTNASSLTSSTTATTMVANRIARASSRHTSDYNSYFPLQPQAQPLWWSTSAVPGRLLQKVHPLSPEKAQKIGHA